MEKKPEAIEFERTKGAGWVRWGVRPVVLKNRIGWIPWAKGARDGAKGLKMAATQSKRKPLDCFVALDHAKGWAQVIMITFGWEEK